MKSKIYDDCKYGVLAGAILNLASFLVSLLAYVQVSTALLGFILNIAGVFAVFVTVFSLIFKKPPLTKMLLRSLCLLVSFFAFWILGAYLGIWRTAYLYVNPKPSSASDNVSGMLWFLPFGVAQLSSVITILFKVIHCVVAYVRRLMRRT